jgi:hypothetical protein
VSNAVEDNPNGNDGYDGTEMVLINPKKDIWTYQIPMGMADVERYKHQAAQALALKIVKEIDPEFLEMPGFELIRYQVIVKKYE